HALALLGTRRKRRCYPAGNERDELAPPHGLPPGRGIWSLADQKRYGVRECRFGSLADIALRPRHVRFTPKSRHWKSVAKCPLCAKSGHASYFGSTLTCCSTTTGRVNANVEPWPGCDSTQILPPCISMMRFDMASPSRAWSAAVMPGPVSRTDT